jgi:hypothetical protein
MEELVSIDLYGKLNESHHFDKKMEHSSGNTLHVHCASAEIYFQTADINKQIQNDIIPIVNNNVIAFH